MSEEDSLICRARLLKAIKEHPEIWNPNNKQYACDTFTAPMWEEIAEELGGRVGTAKLRAIWNQLKYHYNNLVQNQMLHKDSYARKWKHFKPMSFMYNITVARISAEAASNTDGPQERQHAPQRPQGVPLKSHHKGPIRPNVAEITAAASLGVEPSLLARRNSIERFDREMERLRGIQLRRLKEMRRIMRFEEKNMEAATEASGGGSGKDNQSLGDEDGAVGGDVSGAGDEQPRDSHPEWNPRR